MDSPGHSRWISNRASIARFSSVESSVIGITFSAISFSTLIPAFWYCVRPMSKMHDSPDVKALKERVAKLENEINELKSLIEQLLKRLGINRASL